MTRVIGSPLKKPTGFLSNAPMLLRALNKRCEGRNGDCSRSEGGVHVPVEGRIARESAIYSKGLCRTILAGIKAQMHEDGLLQQGCFGQQARDDEKQRSDEAQQPRPGTAASISMILPAKS